MSSSIRLVLISDTHGFHDFPVPPGDVLVHAGDGCSRGTLDEAREWAAFVHRQPHRHKIVIAGNHDRCFEADFAVASAPFAGLDFLHDSGCERLGVRFWGSPWQPWFLSWAFNLPRGPELAAKWALIPDDTDVLVTHGPPHGILDRTYDHEPVGCEQLRIALGRVRPRVHVFGHIHEGYGAAFVDGTLFVNASTCTLAYRPTNPAIVVDLPIDRTRPAQLIC
ncbi:MAG TPA: metallophosphatase domain-containing protein [Enhygromyxa sp.]|nr:metallophosphatase domain-containing protein [Enhygromyxa sp.]